MIKLIYHDMRYHDNYRLTLQRGNSWRHPGLFRPTYSHTSCCSLIRAPLCQTSGPGWIPGMSCSESASTWGNPIMLLPSSTFLRTMCKYEILTTKIKKQISERVNSSLRVIFFHAPSVSFVIHWGELSYQSKCKVYKILNIWQQIGKGQISRLQDLTYN
jgi:hypothetical protein